MESLSRGHLHTRKLSNGNGGFSSKNAYDGLFSGQKKFGAPKFSARPEDYREIFGSSQGSAAASSIPVLDLSDFDDPNGSSNLRSSKPDYSKIFGAFRDDDDGAVSYEELFGRVNGVKNSPEKPRTTSARRQPSQDSEDLFDTSNQSSDALKQFNMSYHKTSQRSKDGSNGTTYVAQLHDVPGFTCFIDEIKMASSQKAEAETQKSSTVNVNHPKSDERTEAENGKKAYEQTSGSAVKSKSSYSRGASFSDDKLFNAYEINVKSHPSKLPSPSFMPPYSENQQAPSNGPVASNSGAPETDVSESDEELDVNSAAAASVAALKKAIEKAQESIRIAKESVGRKKEGLRGFSNKSFKDSLKVKGREATYKNVASEVSDLMERENACKGGVLCPDFKDGENLFVARRVIDEMHGKILESVRQHERSSWSAPELKESESVPVSREVRDETTGKNQESAEKFEAPTWSFDQLTAEKVGTVGSAFELPFSENNIHDSADYHESKLECRTTNETLEEQGFIKELDAVEKSCEVEDTERKPSAEVRLHRLESACLVDEERENGLPSSKQEEQKVMEKPQGFFKLVNFVKSLRGFVETTEDDKKVSAEVKDDDYKVRGNEAPHLVGDENKLNESQEMIENEQKDHDFEKGFSQAQEQFEIGKAQEQFEFGKAQLQFEIGKAQEQFEIGKAQEQFEIGKEQEEVLEKKNIEKAEKENGQGKDCDHNVSEKILEEVSQWVEDDVKELDVSNEREKEDTHKEEAIDKWLDEVHELDINEKAQTYVHDMDESEVRLQDGFKIKQDDNQKGEETEKLSEESNDEKDSGEALKEKCEWRGDDNLVTEDYIYEERESTASGTDGDEENLEIEMPQKVDYEEIFGRDSDGFNQDTSSIALETQDTCNVEIDDSNVEIGQEANDSGLSPQVTKPFSEFKQERAEAVEVSNRVQENEILEAPGRTSSEDDEREFEVKEVHEAFSSNEYEGEYGLADKEVGVNEIRQTDGQSDVTVDGTEAVSNEAVEAEELIKEEVKIASPQEERKLFPKRAYWDLEGFRLPNIPKEKEEEVSNETVEVEELIKEEVKIASPQEERKLFPKRAYWDLEGFRLPNIPKEKEQTVEIKDEYKRSQYRGKTVENYSETMEDKKDKETEIKKVEEKKQLKELDEATKRQREREKDRMAVERVIREARERAYAEIRERTERAAVERATAEVRQRVMAEAREKMEKVSAASEKASAEAKIRAERAAVERATAEARERALEKAMSQKTTTSERFVAEKFSGASRDAGMRQSSSSDLHRSSGTISESAQRSKAKLEKHNRIMERAAKALAEKEKRDLLAQREQNERNRLSETLDLEIKRWSTGKQGNLRALLSTLQYILGSDSGWQPVSLTDIITTNAVKKAYRKATLVVHPDKVQQRGASIQQKYICEKVFDLLKAAWNRFNSEER